MHRPKVLLALPHESLIQALSEELSRNGMEIEVIPYLKGILPTLLDKPKEWKALIISEQIHRSVTEEERLYEVLDTLTTLRSHKQLAHLHIIVLADLAERHPFFRELVATGIYSLINGPVRIPEVIRLIASPQTYADVQELIDMDRTISWRASQIDHQGKPRTTARTHTVIKEKTIEVRQRQIAVLSFYPSGSSVFAYSLARLLSEYGKEIHLWDGDSRYPALYYYAGAQAHTSPAPDHQIHYNSVIAKTASLTLHTRFFDHMPTRELSIDDYVEFQDTYRNQYDHLVVDLSGSHNSQTSQFIIKQATDVVIVLDVNPVRWLHHYPTITQWRATAREEKLHWILARCEPAQDRIIQSAEQLFGITISACLPDISHEVGLAMTHGKTALSILSRDHLYRTELEQYIRRHFSIAPAPRWYKRWLRST